MNEDTLIITNYVSYWGWHIVGMIFLSTSAIMMAMEKIPFSFAFIILMAIVEYMALTRKREVLKYD